MQVDSGPDVLLLLTLLVYRHGSIGFQVSLGQRSTDLDPKKCSSQGLRGDHILQDQDQDQPKPDDSHLKNKKDHRRFS